MINKAKDWKSTGVRIVRHDQLDSNTAQTPGMQRMAAITAASANAQKIWAGTVAIHPAAKTGAHHHGELESIIYVVSGRARMRWGEKLEFTAEAEKNYIMNAADAIEKQLQEFGESWEKFPDEEKIVAACACPEALMA